MSVFPLHTAYPGRRGCVCHRHSQREPTDRREEGEPFTLRPLQLSTTTVATNMIPRRARGGFREAFDIVPNNTVGKSA